MASRGSANRVLVVVSLAQFIVLVDAVVVNVALPTIRRDLGFSDQNLAWIIDAYLLTFGGFLLLGGRLADRLGRRRMFITGLSLFTGASLLCGLAQSGTLLLIARGLQGISAAIVSPAALSIILTTFAEGHARNHALAVWGEIAGAGAGFGLLLGGLVVALIGWRWVFFINVPIGAVVIALSPRIVPESRAPSNERRAYDVGGALAVTVSTLALVFTLVNGNSWGWSSPATIGGFAVFAMLAVALLIIERRVADPLIPLRIFRNRSLAAADATVVLASAAPFGMAFFATLYLQQVLGFSALESGLGYLPFTATATATSASAARLVDRFSPKPVLVAGLAISCCGFLLMSGISGHGDYATRVLPAMVVVGLGAGMTFVPITLAATSGVTAAHSGLASGLLSTTQQIGGALGLAILTPIAAAATASARLAGSSAPLALTHGFQLGFVVAASMSAASALFALVFLPRARRQPAPASTSELAALSLNSCPGGPNCGHLTRLALFGRRRARAAVSQP